MSLAYNYYFYNGGGVTTCDFNNDGLEDVYFTGNHVPSRLYINKGNLNFKDVTKESGLLNDYWSSGSTFVDINGDGLQDLFVCTVGKNEPNLLYINKGMNGYGIPKFSEMAEDFGLVEKMASTQAAFLDFDRDNDLDLFIAINSQVMNNRNETVKRNQKEMSYTIDKFYLNNGNNTFTDVSVETGIINEGYSLGVAINDLNNDGWPDIYVANDFLSNDLIYINNQNGKFVEKGAEMLRHASQNSMGVDIADFNQDGLMDITVVDMLPQSNRRRKMMLAPINYDLYEYRKELGYIPQLVRNTLQINNGIDPGGFNSFSEIGCLTGMYSTDWSWAPLWVDFDNNTTLDLYITNGYYRDLTDLDYSLGLEQDLQFGTADYLLDIQLEGIDKLRTIKESNFLYLNDGSLILEDISTSSGISEASYSHGSAYSDLDNDGDLDLVVNNLGHEAFLFENTTNKSSNDKIGNHLDIRLNGPGQNTNAIGSRISLFNKGESQEYFHSNVRGYLSSMGSTIHFGLGSQMHIDSIQILWPDGKILRNYNVEANQTIYFDHSSAENPEQKEMDHKTIFEELTDSLQLNYAHLENQFVDFKNDPLLLKMYTKEGPSMAVGDVNNDGEDDLIVGGAAGIKTTLFVQEYGVFREKSILAADSLYEDMGMLLFDFENDGDLDLYVTSGGAEQLGKKEFYQDRFYINSDGEFQRDYSIPSIMESTKVVKGADFDRDGDIDLFVGGMILPGQYPRSPQSNLLINTDGKMTIPMSNPVVDIGMISDAIWTDFNGDDWLDLIVIGEWTDIIMFKNNKGILERHIDNGIEGNEGWWNSIAGGDFDHDGDIDYILGNYGLNSYLSASKEKPIRMYVGDYDENGKPDPILSYYTVNDENELNEFPVHTRDALIDQVVGYKRRFKDFKSFANAEFSEVLKSHDRKGIKIMTANNLSSSYLENLGGGYFQISPLPIECQISPVYGVLIDDFNMDGNLDAIVTGNQNSAEPLFGNFDASNGTYLIGDGTGNFKAVQTVSSGLFLDQDQKSVVNMVVNNKKVMIAGANSGSLTSYGFSALSNPTSEFYTFKAHDVNIEVTYADGRKTKRECYYGNSYLSQSTRKIELTDRMVKVTVQNTLGEKIRLR
ncbi:MAG: VCBS repeat-containing protein [Reichenbachiella sp.]